MLIERTDYFYQAVTTTTGMVSKTPAVGQAVLVVYALRRGHAQLYRHQETNRRPKPTLTRVGLFRASNWLSESAKLRSYGQYDFLDDPDGLSL